MPDIGERIMNLPAKVNRGLSNDYQNGFYDGHHGARCDAATLAREARDAEVAELREENQRLREACKAAKKYIQGIDPKGVSHKFTRDREMIQRLQTAIGGKGDNRDT